MRTRANLAESPANQGGKKKERIMRKRLVSIAAILALAVSAMAGEAENRLKAHINAQFKGFVAAFKKKDMAGVEAKIRGFFHKDFLNTDPQGKVMNLEEMIATEKQHMAGMRSIQEISLKLPKVKVYGVNSARTTEEFRLYATISLPDNPDKVSKLKVVSKGTSEYRKVYGRWMAHSSKASSEQVWIDGVLMPPGM